MSAPPAKPLHTDCSTPFCGVQECEQLLEVLRKQERDLAALVHPEQAYQASSQVSKLHPGVVFHACTSLQICKLRPGIILCAYTSLQGCKLHLCTLCALHCKSTSACIELAIRQAVLNSTSSFACLTMSQTCTYSPNSYSLSHC